MRKLTITFISSLLSFLLHAQPVFKTEMPLLPITVGESFRVQYVVEGLEADRNLTPPRFTDFRLVNGPEVYHMNGSISLSNVVYTLEAIKPGKFIIPGATTIVNGRLIQSNDVIVEVIPKGGEDESPSAFFLQPGEDPYEKMRNNLFMKVMVDRRNCFIGQPVVATFKLYSRLQSKSDIVKNPGFYGFTVQDIISLDDNVSHTETIDGKIFDVHTVRSVQLYPLQAGLFTIDPMEVMNKVEFSKSMVNKKTEQEISEGRHENKNETSSNGHNTETYENSISTEKIAINVKPYPDKNKPAVFNGATGNFIISAILEKNDLAKNEEGDLVVTIAGKGNFPQLSAPSIQWPAGIEGFDAAIKDSLDKMHTPLKGTRAFRFPFVAANAGLYIIPAISIAFFDTDSNSYKTIATSPVEIKISDHEKEARITTATIIKKRSTHTALLWAGGIALLLLTAAALWLSKRRKKVINLPAKDEKKPLPSVDELLRPAYTAMEKNDSSFYAILQKAIWDYLGTTLNLYGSNANKSDLWQALRTNGLAEDQSKNILDILQECEAAAFTKAEFVHDKQKLLTVTKNALERLLV